MADQMRDRDDERQQSGRKASGRNDDDRGEENTGPSKQQGDGFRGADGNADSERPDERADERGEGEGGYGGSSGWAGGTEGATDATGSDESGARRRDREQSGGSGNDQPEPREGMRSQPSMGGSQIMPEGDGERADRREGSDVSRERPHSPPDLH